MKEFYKSGPEETRHINRWLAGNCFGDYYTRGGLDLKQREMITFCFISAQGGCEPQLKAHGRGETIKARKSLWQCRCLMFCFTKHVRLEEGF